MIQASTIQKTEWLSDALNRSNLKAQLVLEYFDTTLDDWRVIDDLDTGAGVSWDKSAKKYKYAAVTLTPLASSISFSILNRNAQYSVGSGTDVSGIFDLDTRVRIKAGYLIPVDTKSTEETVFTTGGSTSTDSIHFHTKFTSGELFIDKINFVRNTKYFTDLFGLATVQYNQNPIYTPTGFYIFTKDFEGDNFNTVTDIDITANNTKYKIYTRSFSDLEAAETGWQSVNTWTLEGNTINGAKNITLDLNKRFFQVALIPDGIGDWDSTEKVSELKFTYDVFIEYLYKDIFFLDSPVFTDPTSPEMPMIKCKGRDIYKRALSSDVNIENVNGKSLDTILKTLLDRVGIEYTATSIDDLSSFGNRTLAGGLGDSTKLEKVFEFIMQIITQGTNRYQMYTQYDSVLDTNIFFLKLKPTDFVADFVFNYRHYKNIGSYHRNFDKMLQRVTIADKKIDIDELVLLDTQVISGAGSGTFSWAGDACFLEFEITVGSLGIGETIVNTGQTATTLAFTVTGSSPSFTIVLRGCKTTNTPVFGEFVHIENSLNRKGTTPKLINKLVLDTAEYISITKELMVDFSNPVIQLNGLQFPYLHLILELNDMTMNWARFVFNDDLSPITGFKHRWSDSQDSTTFNSDDSGLNFSDVGTFDYDDVMIYGIGYVYDMGISTTLDTDAEVDAASDLLKIVNLEFT